ncbi:hypothetical protein HK097_004800 [Rhizophlyctis rosea]|uniref:S-formylglutathione hydrolase n=1 Tax=Rhizophlyctis rosea TaxID=64517 RepID=A0AAD5X715_9FUNG|nr:hypothetical protein HK097_004800 [Rhizophlyctis rosea]
MSTALKQLSQNKCFGGLVTKYVHQSAVLGCEMKFQVFIPHQQSSTTKFPGLYFLSGLTCTEDNFIQKAGAQRKAAQLGIALIAPDTSPRGLNIKGEDDSWDFGTGAGFYVNATESKWKNYQMYSYVTQELPKLVNENLPIDPSRISISGHSMGGHGALICALKNPTLYKSVSAFAPISNPTDCPWGIKAFTGYLGASNKHLWEQYDASILLGKYDGPVLDVLVEVGDKDQWLEEQLKVHKLTDKKNEKVKLEVRWQEGYDHSYFFIQSFVEDHIAFHAKHLQ